MTREQLEQIARVYKRRGYEHFPTVIDREVFQVGYRAAMEACRAEHVRLEHGTDNHSFEQDWDALREWLDAKLKETGA